MEFKRTKKSPKWANLIYREDLTEDELRSIPASSCENSRAELNYYIKRKGLKEEELTAGLCFHAEYYRNPNHWINALDEVKLHKNIFKRSKELWTHYDVHDAGLNFTLSDNSLFLIMIKLMNSTRILKEISKNVRKFNNEYDITPVNFKSGSAMFIIDDYPFYRKIALGHECRFVEGVMAANFKMHNVSGYAIKHILCCKRIKNLVKGVYGHLGWTYKIDRDYVYINGIKIGEFVHLLKERRGNEMIYTNNVGSGRTKNAVRIIADFNYAGKPIFQKGEIYNAPYCLLDVKWKEPSFFTRMVNTFFMNWRLRPHYIAQMEEQIDFTKAKLFEAQSALLESERKSNIFRIYTKSSLVEIVDKGDNPTTYSPSRRNMAILFSDIKDYTRLTEKMDSAEAVSFLNSYFNIMNHAIQKNDGEIDKLIGDCLMAGFYNANDAVRASIQMRKKLQEYNRERYEKGLPLASCGIGITYGPVMLGNIGSSGKLDYTLVGDVVNVASRLESLAKYYNVGIVISEDAKHELVNDFDLRFLDMVQVKGRSEPLRIYEVFDHEPDDIRKKKMNLLPKSQEAFSLYLDRDFEGAATIYNELIDEIGEHRYSNEFCADPVLNFYSKRCNEVRRQFDAGIMTKSSWKGVYLFRHK